MPFTFEGVYFASAGRTALTAGVPLPSSTLTITGTNWMEVPKKARIIKALAAITDTAANTVAGEYALNASHDPNYVRGYVFADQTLDTERALMKQNYPLIDPQGQTAIFRALESNANNAEITNLHFIASSEDFKGISDIEPVNLPPNLRAITGTATITSVLGTWVAGAVTFNFNFNPKMKYAVYGGFCSGSTLTGWRLVPKAGSEPADLYPGAPACDTHSCATTFYSIDGTQPWLTFMGSNPPDLAITAVTAAAQAPTLMLLIAEV